MGKPKFRIKKSCKDGTLLTADVAKRIENRRSQIGGNALIICDNRAAMTLYCYIKCHRCAIFANTLIPIPQTALRLYAVNKVSSLQGSNLCGHILHKALPCAIDIALSELLALKLIVRLSALQKCKFDSVDFQF